MRMPERRGGSSERTAPWRPAGAETWKRDGADADDRLLAKLAQLARFGLAAEAAPILAETDRPED